MTKGKRIATKAQNAKGIIKLQRIAGTGLTSRIRGHVSARTKRVQARKDARPR